MFNNSNKRISELGSDFNNRFSVSKKRKTEYIIPELSGSNEEILTVIKIEEPSLEDDNVGEFEYSSMNNVKKSNETKMSSLNPDIYHISIDNAGRKGNNQPIRQQALSPSLPEFGEHCMTSTIDDDEPLENDEINDHNSQVLQLLGSIKNDLRILQSTVESQRSAIRKLNSKVTEQTDIISCLVNQVNRSKMAPNRNIQVDPVFIMPTLPIDDLNELRNFNISLKEKNFQDQMILRLQSCISSNRPNEIVKHMLEKMFTYPLILKHTWSGQSGLNGDRNRLPFKNNEGIMILLERAANFKRLPHEEISDMDLRKSIREFFKRAKIRAANR